jgi:A/G-specific adenine glycosylase
MITWNNQTIKDFRKALLDWYDKTGRSHLPWRKDTDPYHVWVSEIMLQQTQVDTVVPYYERFLETLPTVQDLAEANEDLLLNLWSGLGYYSRVRNMQKAAQEIVNDYKGIWPHTSKELERLTGIGPYTAAAIASISFGGVVPAIDGNMFRVFARLLKIDADIAQPKTRKLFYEMIQPIVDPDRPGDFNQAIMDLGSSYMSAKTATTAASPVAKFNASYQDGTELDYPVKTKKTKPVPKYYAALISQQGDTLAYQQRPETGLLANFYTFPLVEANSWDAILPTVEAQYGQAYQLNITPVTHVFSHQKWQVMLVQVSEATGDDWTYMTDAHFQKQPKTTLQVKLFKALQETLGDL